MYKIVVIGTEKPNGLDEKPISSQVALNKFLGNKWSEQDLSQIGIYKTTIGCGFAILNCKLDGKEGLTQIQFHFISDAERYSKNWESQTKNADAFLVVGKKTKWQNEKLENKTNVHKLSDFSKPGDLLIALTSDIPAFNVTTPTVVNPFEKVKSQVSRSESFNWTPRFLNMQKLSKTPPIEKGTELKEVSNPIKEKIGSNSLYAVKDLTHFAKSSEVKSSNIDTLNDVELEEVTSTIRGLSYNPMVEK